ncbi:MAG: hypothetical protein P9M15_01115 [Candidatus Electryoneaceae bacterium]|nr:hypothetical protein [Candidatus Electryoneaceae bacterium]
MLRRIIAFILLITVIIGIHIYFTKSTVIPDQSLTLETPSPALGQAIANAIHQTVTDPYLVPLEKLADFLATNPNRQEIAVDLLAKWAPDNEIPTGFVWNVVHGGFQIDHPTSPWVLETVMEQVRETLDVGSNNLLHINVFETEGERYWLGFLCLPYTAIQPNQVAGVFFSIDDYLDETTPRLIYEMINRPRFPLVPFQRNISPIHGEPDGDIAIRILDDHGETYFQHGRMYDPEKMIYAESQYHSHPIVCLQQGWDLQVFSANVITPSSESNQQRPKYILLIIELFAVTVLYWIGAVVIRKQA